MLPTNLTTNEVMNTAGTEVEFLRWRTNERQVEFALSGEAPNLNNHLLVSHQSVGSGVDERRRSAVIVTKEVTGASGVKRLIKVSIVADIPEGDIATYTDVITAMAEAGSFTFTSGTSTFVYAGTGNGASAIINGTL
jgi:hypothetical protein